jgi:hypothetical protein
MCDWRTVMETILTTALTLALTVILVIVGLVVLYLVVAFFVVTWDVWVKCIAAMGACVLAFVGVGYASQSAIIRALVAQIPETVEPHTMLVLMGAVFGLTWVVWRWGQQRRGRR